MRGTRLLLATISVGALATSASAEARTKGCPDLAFKYPPYGKMVFRHTVASTFSSQGAAGRPKCSWSAALVYAFKHGSARYPREIAGVRWDICHVKQASTETLYWNVSCAQGASGGRTIRGRVKGKSLERRAVATTTRPTATPCRATATWFVGRYEVRASCRPKGAHLVAWAGRQRIDGFGSRIDFNEVFHSQLRLAWARGYPTESRDPTVGPKIRVTVRKI